MREKGLTLEPQQTQNAAENDSEKLCFSQFSLRRSGSAVASALLPLDPNERLDFAAARPH
jgi:hypothetical protein